MRDFEGFMRKFKLFWQYPVITEKTFYEQNKSNPRYFAVPWATMLDKKYNIQLLAKLLSGYIETEESFTCCQHIRFREIVPLCQYLNIKTIYTPHKKLDENSINGVRFVACPLYAVNFEDKDRNKEFRQVNFLNKERDLLYSFMGGYNKKWYMSNLRELLYNMKHEDDTLVINTGEWHFDRDVYNKSQSIEGKLNEDDEHKLKTSKYNETLLRSRYSICPSGSGPNSIRLWESMACGAIPVILSDMLDLPNHPLIDRAVLRLDERYYPHLHKVLEKISKEDEEQLRLNCLRVYNDLRNNYTNIKKDIIHYCDGAYHRGQIGGVARYDYQIWLAFPTRVFFKGPQERNKMLEYVKSCKNPLIITDNHLSCDIPNNYNILLVHHGVAKTHADREPDWNEYWKNLCCSGQEKMLQYRDPKTTKILSISQFCTDEFEKYYPLDYSKFEKETILHSSELDERREKKKWNRNPIVLGNWANVNKGSDVIRKIGNKWKNFIFKKLSIMPKSLNIIEFNKTKQDIYLDSDIFLQLSLCEGNSYATLDALLCGLPVVSTNVGLFYKDVPEDCFVKIEWNRKNDMKYVKEKLLYAWENKEDIGRKGREWYMKHCRMMDWKDKMWNIVNK